MTYLDDYDLNGYFQHKSNSSQRVVGGNCRASWERQDIFDFHLTW